MICAKFCWTVVLEKKIFKFCICIFAISNMQLFPLGKGHGPFIFTNLNSLNPRMFCVKFGWNSPKGSGEDDFQISSMYFLLFCNYLPLEMGVTLYLKKNWISSTKDALCKVLLKMAKWFFRRRWKCEKFTDAQTDGGTGIWTDGQMDRQTTVDQKISLELSAQVS